MNKPMGWPCFSLSDTAALRPPEDVVSSRRFVFFISPVGLGFFMFLCIAGTQLRVSHRYTALEMKSESKNLPKEWTHSEGTSRQTCKTCTPTPRQPRARLNPFYLMFLCVVTVGFSLCIEWNLARGRRLSSKLGTRPSMSPLAPLETHI